MFSYDTGAATTALLVDFAERFPSREVGEFIVATGHDIPNFGRAKFQTVDEVGNKRKMEGHGTDVHTPLASASEISKYQDAFIFEEFGALSPRHSRVAEGLRRVSSIVSASWLLWTSTSVSGRNIVQILHGSVCWTGWGEGHTGMMEVWWVANAYTSSVLHERVHARPHARCHLKINLDVCCFSRDEKSPQRVSGTCGGWSEPC